MTRFIFVLSLAAALGCAADPAIKNFPRRQIDRPITLPDGLDSLNVTAASQLALRRNSGVSDIPFVPGISWNQSLSDEWMLQWAPIPLGIVYQPLRTDTDVFAASLGLGFGFSSVVDLLLVPELGFHYRHKFADDFALSTSAIFRSSLAFDDGNIETQWSGRANLAPLFQLSETLMLAARVSLATAFYADSIQSARITVPLGFRTAWSFHRQWDASFDYDFGYFGLDSGLQTHSGVLAVSHFW